MFQTGAADRLQRGNTGPVAIPGTPNKKIKLNINIFRSRVVRLGGLGA